MRCSPVPVSAAAACSCSAATPASGRAPCSPTREKPRPAFDAGSASSAAQDDPPVRRGSPGSCSRFSRGWDDLPAPQAQALGVALALREGDAVDRFAVSAAALTLTTRAAESGPLGLVDDAHLLDTPSAQALAFVARRLLVDAVFLLAAVRPGVTDVWNGLPTLDLLPLGPVAADVLVVLAARDVLTPEQRRRITAVERRQPARDPGTRPRARLGGATPPGLAAAVPSVVAEAFARRTAGLTVDEVRVLQVAVIASGDVPTVAAVCSAEGLSLDLLRRAETLGVVALRRTASSYAPACRVRGLRRHRPGRAQAVARARGGLARPG